MKKFIINLENNTARKYGLEVRRTLRVFRFTAILRKVFGITE